MQAKIYLETLAVCLQVTTTATAPATSTFRKIQCAVDVAGQRRRQRAGRRPQPCVTVTPGSIWDMLDKVQELDS